MIDLKGRVVIVTGGSQGLGKAMAIGIAKAGGRVVLASPDRERLERTADEIGRDRALPVLSDITREEDCARIVDEAVRAFGDVHVLINNARRIIDRKHSEFWNNDIDFWRDAVLVNVYGPFLMAKAVAPRMFERGWGRIINHATGAGSMRRAKNSPYGATKAALDSETLIWAAEVEGTGVTVNAVNPGAAVDTDARALPPLSGASRLLKPEVIVPPTVWLCSDLSDGFNGGCYMGNRWDLSLPPTEAARKAKVELAIIENQD